MQDRKLGLVGGIVRSAQLHPWRTVEHCALILLALHLASGRACQHAGEDGSLLCPAGQQQCCCAANTPGPMTVLGAEGVLPAPQPTMPLANLRPGQTVEHHDFRGDIYRFKMGDGVILNLMKTTAGTMRSGDLHNCTQFDVILEGRARLVTYDTVTKRETSITYGRNDFIKIPARVPHLFEFLEDNYMVEWWDCEFVAWYWQPYRDRISRAFEAAKAKDEAAKAGVASAGSASESGFAGDAVQAAADREMAGNGSVAEAAHRQRAEEQAAQQQAAAVQRGGLQDGQSDAASMAGRSRADATIDDVATGLARSATRDGAQEVASQGDAVGSTDAGGAADGTAERRLRDPGADASDTDALAAGDAGVAALPAAGAAASQIQQIRQPQGQAGVQGQALQQGSVATDSSALTRAETSRADQSAPERQGGQKQGQLEEDPDLQMAAGADQGDYV